MNFKEWKEVKLGLLGEIIGGGTPSTKNSSNYGGNIPWITPKDLSNYTERYISKGERMITTTGLAGSSAKLLPKDTILFSSRAPIGYIAIAGKELSTNQGFKSIIPKDDVSDSMFLYYLLKYRKQDIESVANGTTFMEVSGSSLKNFYVTIPQIDEQKAIAAILSSLDDKVELNNRMNKILEEMAQAIFRSWFVDFEPFQEGEFEDSELGRIPKDWKVGTLEECINVFDSKRIPLSSKQRESMRKIYPYYGAASLMDYVDNYIFDGVYVLLGEDGTVINDKGYPILQYVWGKFWVNNHAHILKGKNGLNENSLYMLLKNTSVQGIVTGAVQPKINQANLKSLKVMIPANAIISEFNDLIEPLFAARRRNYKENQALISMRDSLLPKLMSGEIRVPLEEVQ
ncbi:MAG: restriction endonuclease subunit S [Porphyromonadaceae bacterium]|nr:restriction endonuclease subunit S [Porphyromonadaceae bacterium]